jgi:hypothetical protein
LFVLQVVKVAKAIGMPFSAGRRVLILRRAQHFAIVPYYTKLWILLEGPIAGQHIAQQQEDKKAY